MFLFLKVERTEGKEARAEEVTEVPEVCQSARATNNKT